MVTDNDVNEMEAVVDAMAGMADELLRLPWRLLGYLQYLLSWRSCNLVHCIRLSDHLVMAWVVDHL